MTEQKLLCKHIGLERLPSGNGLTLSSCCHEDSDINCHAICVIQNQKRCIDYEVYPMNRKGGEGCNETGL